MVIQRTIDQEPDAIALIPDHPDFFVVGTYSLVSTNSETGSSARRGSLQIFRISDNGEQSSVILDRKDFDFGIYDLGFHPRFPSILGVATSNGQVLFYQILPTKDYDGQIQCLRLQEIGSVAAEGGDEPDAVNVIITQIQFLDECNLMDTTPIAPAGLHHLIMLLVATTQSGHTNMIRIRLTGRDVHLSDANIDPQHTQLQTIHKQSFDLEAWTVLLLPMKTSSKFATSDPNRYKMIAASGGDDSQLLISLVNFESKVSSSDSIGNSIVIDLEEVTYTRLASDKRTHEAGIVSTCLLPTDLPELKRFADDSHILLTGSYDEKIRLIQLKMLQTNGGRCEVILLSEFAMPGGVWRILLLSSYKSLAGTDCLFLIAGHTAGAFILRLTLTPPEDNFAEAPQGWHYSWKIEKHFTQHQSLVYAVAAGAKTEQQGIWQVISTSFYDKLICEWEWEDREWRSQYSTV